MKRLVILESPYAADTPEGVYRNVAYARRCLRDALLKGEAPIASHLLYTQPGVLDDRNPEERKLGIEAGLLWGVKAEASVFYLDHGVSKGMLQGRDRALKERRAIELRHLVMPLDAHHEAELWSGIQASDLERYRRLDDVARWEPEPVTDHQWNEITDDDRCVWESFLRGHAIASLRVPLPVATEFLQLLADHRANGMSLMQARYQPNPLEKERYERSEEIIKRIVGDIEPQEKKHTIRPEFFDAIAEKKPCVPEEPGRRRCATHDGLPLYPSGRCLEGSGG